MRSFLVLGAAAAVYANPAPQGMNFGALNAIPVTAVQGPPVGVGVAQVTAYDQGRAQATAAGVATAAATAGSVNKREVKRDSDPAPNPTSTNIAPSSCTPVNWSNTYSFTSIPACPTQVEVGTYCGFINPLDPCAAQPNAAFGPTTPDTPDAFKNYQAYHDLAKNAQTPTGYDQAFSDLGGSVSGGGYLGYKTLTAYNPATCAAYCDSTATCTGFNIFIERDPAWNQDKCSCESPSIGQIKCSIWGQNVTPDSATNTGQNQAGFEVVITASNGYNKKPATPPTPNNCNNPQNCGGKVHNHQSSCMGEKTFPGPFDPTLCAAYAQQQNQVNRKAGILGFVLSLFGVNKAGCVQFQASYLEKGGKGFGTNCRLFTQKFTPSQATLSINNNGYTCSKSYTWDVDTNASFNWGVPFLGGQSQSQPSQPQQQKQQQSGWSWGWKW